jgi:RluA family pseudouridine synthase
VIRTLFESDAFIAVDKPPRTLVIPGRTPEPGGSLKEQLEGLRQERLFTVHRLDRDTSGVLLFARTAPAHRALSMAFEAGQLDKRYWALCRHALTQERLVQRALAPARKGLMRVARPGETIAKDAVTRLKPLERFLDATWIEAIPLTGRTHQIRVHLLAEELPLLVDPQYRQPAQLTEKELGGSSEEVLLSRTPLHCARLDVPALEGIPAVTIEAPMPEDMERTLRALRPHTE